MRIENNWRVRNIILIFKACHMMRNYIVRSWQFFLNSMIQNDIFPNPSAIIDTTDTITDEWTQTYSVKYRFS